MRRLLLLPLLLAVLVWVDCQSVHAAATLVTWLDNSSGTGQEDNFVVERRIGQTGSFTDINHPAQNAKAYTDTTVSVGTEYCYRVKAVNTAGSSAFGNTACKTVVAVAGMPASAIADARYSLGYLVCDYYTNVSGNDSTNNTPGTNDLNTCIKDAYDNQLVAFLSACGTYRISTTLKMYEWIGWNSSTNAAISSPPFNTNILRGTHLCGGVVRPIVKLNASASGFTDAANPRPMIAVRTFEAQNSGAVVGTAPSNPLGLPSNFRNRDAQCFQTFIEGIDFHTNANAGAIGVVFPCAQGSGFFNSTITATSSYAGMVGLPGRNSVTANISVTGGQYCFRSGPNVPNSTYNGTAGIVVVGLTCTGQTTTTLIFEEDVPPVLVGFDLTKSSDGSAILANLESVLVDGKISMSGSAADDLAINNVNSRNMYVREVWVTGSTSLIRSNGNTVAGSGTWAKIIEYVTNDQFSKDASTNPTTFPGYTAGNARFEARSIINGVLGAAGNPVVLTANSAATPSADLLSRHVWTSLPSFEDGAYEDPRNYSGVSYLGLDPETNSTTGTISTSALQSAINSASGANFGTYAGRVVIPRGSLYINGNITVPANVKLIGAGPRVSVIAQADSWAPTSAVPMLTTADDASATTYVGFLSLWIKTQPTATDFVSFLKWRGGKNSSSAALLLDAQFLAKFVGSGPTNQPRKAVEFTGNGGGRHWISFTPEQIKSTDRNTGYCIICLSSNTQPLSIYGCNSEAGKWVAAPQGVDIKVVSSNAGFRCYGIKREGSSRIATIADSSNVGLFGVGAISTNIGDNLNGGLQVTGGSSNILIANVTVRDMAQISNNESMIREAITGETAFSTVPYPNGIAIYKRGTIFDDPFMTSPPSNPPSFQSATVNAINTVDICFVIFDGTPMLPSTGATGFTFTVNTVSKTPTSVVLTSTSCYRATFAASTITVNTQVVTVAYTPGNITAGGTGTPAAAAFTSQTASNLLSGSTPPVLLHTRYQFYRFYDDWDTSLPYFSTENVPLRAHIGSLFRVVMKVTNTVAQAASEPLFPYISIDGAAAVPLPDTCTSSPVAFADVPELGSYVPLTTRRLTQDQATFVQGYYIESTGAAVPIQWPAPSSETEIGIPIQICPTATVAQTFRLSLYRAGGLPFATYDNATTPFFDIVSQRSSSSITNSAGGGVRQ